MNAIEFEALLHRIEGETLDFKERMYNISYDPDKARFIKDIICMVNTPREEDSYIVLGVRKNPDGSNVLCGLDKDLDTELLISQFPPDRIYPIPSFSYSIVDYHENRFGVISIPWKQSGPCVPIKDYPTSRAENSHNILRAQQVYWRKGSKNSLATPEEIYNIARWFKGISVEGISTSPSENAWERLLEGVHNFSRNRRYLLLAAPLTEGYAKIEHLSAIGRQPWSMVLDFDPNSEESGLLRTVKPVLEEERNPHYVVIPERPVFNVDNDVYWFFARGLRGRLESICTDAYVVWNRRYGNEISEQLKRMAGAINPLPVTCVALWYDTNLISHLRTVLSDIGRAFQDRVNFVIVTKHPADLQPICDEMESTSLVDIPLHQLCSGLQSISKVNNIEENSSTLPSSSGATILLEPKVRLDLEEELELVSLSAGLSPALPGYSRKDFLKGAEAEISWYGLSNNFDIARDRTWKWENDIKEALDKNRIAKIDIFHDAGAGGTTVARRILWNLHFRYPCVILRRCSIDTVDRLYTLTHLTDQSVLLLIDGAQVAERQVDDLRQQLRTRQIPVVMLQVLRRFTEPDEERRPEERKKLEVGLSTPLEANRFVIALSSEAPEKLASLEILAKSPNDRERSAFYMGLETFGKDFRGLTHFVHARIENLTAAQKQILVFLSIALHYGQSSINGQAFAEILGIPRRQTVDFKAALPISARELLVKVSNEWRVIHDFVAEEILQQILGFGDRKEQKWKQNLSSWGINFAYFCRGRETDIPSDEMLELARNVFIYRNRSDFLGTEGSASQRFSHFIEDIPVDEGKIDVLKTVAECYDEDPHFWAHLGRFYSVRKGDTQHAIECLDRAIRLNWNDHVLHHMKGVALRDHVYQFLNDKNSTLEEIINQVILAQKCFEETRKLRPSATHGYTSEVEMLIRVMDYVGRKEVDDNVFTYIKSPKADPFIQECIDRAEELLSMVRWRSDDEEPSIFEIRCRARLDNLYKNFDKALQTLDTLLNHSSTDRPSIRRDIVWTLIARKRRNWELLETSSISRIISLLEENSQEQPYDDRNMLLWIRAIRRAAYPPSLDRIIERISYWRANTNSVDAIFYLYVCNMIKVLEGSVDAREDAARFLDECSRMMRSFSGRNRPLEWFGLKNENGGITRLVNHSELGARILDEATGRSFWENTRKLARVTGRITKYWNPQAGQIEVADSGIVAYFVPARGTNLQASLLLNDKEQLSKSIYGGFGKKDLETKVEFYLAFSYDSLNAWEVTRA